MREGLPRKARKARKEEPGRSHGGVCAVEMVPKALTLWPEAMVSAMNWRKPGLKNVQHPTLNFQRSRWEGRRKINHGKHGGHGRESRYVVV